MRVDKEQQLIMRKQMTNWRQKKTAIAIQTSQQTIIMPSARPRIAATTENLELLLTLQCEAPRKVPSNSLTSGHHVALQEEASVGKAE